MMTAIKLVMGWFTGKSERLKGLLIGAIGIFVIWQIWGFYNHYNGLKAELSDTKISLDKYVKQNDQLFVDIENLQKERNDIIRKYEDSIAQRTQVETQFTQLQEDHENARNVFEKESGRIKRLMQKKSSLIIRLANRASDRMRRKIETTTTTENN